LKLSKEVKTAILVLLALTVLVGGYNYLKGNNLLNNNRIFYAVYDNVEGLNPASNVTLNGQPVGKVLKIELYNGTRSNLVTFNITRDFEFSRSSTAKIYGGGILGGKSIGLEPNYEDPTMAKTGDTLISSMEGGIMELVNESITPLRNQLSSAVIHADSLLQSLNTLLDKETRNELKSAVAYFNATAKELKGITGKTNSLLAENQEKLNNTFSNIDEASTNFSKLSDSLAQVQVVGLSKDLQRLVNDFEVITSDLKSGKGSMGKLLQDEQLYVNLEGTARQMELLLEDFRLQPKRYVHFSLFGKKNKGYITPKDSLR